MMNECAHISRIISVAQIDSIMESSESSTNNHLRHSAAQPLMDAGPSRVAHENDDHGRRSLTLSLPSNLTKFNQLWRSQFQQGKMISTGIKETTEPLRICQPCSPSLPFVSPPSSSITTTVASRHSKRYTNNTEERMLSRSTTSVVSNDPETKILDSSLTSIPSLTSILSLSSSSTSSKSRNNVRWDDTMVVCGHKYTDIRSNGRHVSYTGQVHSTTQVPHGKGTLHFEDGRLFHGEWHHGKLISLHSPPRPPALNGSHQRRGTLQRRASGASAA